MSGLGVSDDERRRIAALLGVAGDSQAIEVEPAPAAEMIGAAGAVGYAWPDGSARVGVYVFEQSEAADAASLKLTDAIRSAGVTARSMIRAGLLLWATARRGDEVAEARIEAVAASFAGAS